jgi:hypothetical protein
MVRVTSAGSMPAGAHDAAETGKLLAIDVSIDECS